MGLARIVGEVFFIKESRRGIIKVLSHCNLIIRPIIIFIDCFTYENLGDSP